MVRTGHVKPQGICPVCKEKKALTTGNTMWFHRDPVTKRECAGVGSQPV